MADVAKTRAQLQEANRRLNLEVEDLSRKLRDVRAAVAGLSKHGESVYVEALATALDLADEGWSYASPYFREKWQCEQRIAELRALLPVPQSSEEPKP